MGLKKQTKKLLLTFCGICGLVFDHTSVLRHKVGNSINNRVGHTKLIAHKLTPFLVVPENIGAQV